MANYNKKLILITTAQLLLLIAHCTIPILLIDILL